MCKEDNIGINFYLFLYKKTHTHREKGRKKERKIEKAKR